MKNNQSLLSQVLAPALYDASPASHYSIPACCDGWFYLLKKVEIDINLKGRGQSTSTLTLFELLEIERLIPSVVTNLIVTPEQKQLLTDYACIQWQIAFDADYSRLQRVYDDLLDELIEHATAIRFFL